MFLVRHSLYNPSFCSDSTNTDSSRFFVKLSFPLEFISCCMSVFSFVLRFSITGDFDFLTNVLKTEIQCLFRLSLNGMKRLWYNADTDMFLVLYSIAVNLYWKIFVFQYMHLCCVGTRYFVLLQLLFLYTSAILASNYGIISSYVDCTSSPLGWYEVEKIIDNSGKFLDLDGNIVMSIGSAEIILGSHLLF